MPDLLTPFRLSQSPSAETVAGGKEVKTSPLARRVRAGISWNISSSFITESIRFVRSIVLARLLVPEDFGLFAMALTIVGALNAVSSLGLTRTIVANKFDACDELKAHLDTVWLVELVRSFLIALLVSVSAFPMSRFYGQEQLQIIVPVLGLSTLIGGFQNIGLVLLRKEVSFARIFWYELITNVVGMASTIALAIVMRNVWALVIGVLITAALGTILSYLFHSYRPRLAIEERVLHNVLSVAKVVLLIAVASYVMNMADNIMVGRLLGSNALGNYSLAFNISSTPISVLVFSLTGVMFPAYAEITTQRPKALELAFIQVFSIALFIMVTIAVSLYLAAGEVIQLLFGSRWTTAGNVLRILAFVIPLRGFALLVSAFFWGLNRPRDVALSTTFEATIFLALLYPLIKTFGVSGAAWSALIAYGFGCLRRVRTLDQIFPGISMKLFQILLTVVVAAGTGLLSAWLGMRFVESLLPRLIIGCLLSTIIPPVILLSFRPELKRSFVEWLS